MVAPTCGFLEEASFILIPYSCYIKISLNSRPMNYPPWSYVIYTGHVYHTRHVVSTKFEIIISFLSLYYIISNHPVTGSIIETGFKIKYYIPFLHILRGLWYLHIFYSTEFILLYYNVIYHIVFDRFVRWHTSHSVTYFRTVFLMSGQYKCWRIITSVLSYTGRRRYVWYHFITYCWSFCGITILFLYVISFIVFQLLEIAPCS